MSLIDPAYFVRDLALPTGKYDTIQAYIDRYEEEIIYSLFGHTIGGLVIDYDSETSDQRIIDLVEGKEYTPTGEDYLIKWKGLINEEKRSFIAYWIYYSWCAEKEVFITPVAGAKSKTENAENVGYGVRAIQAYNKMIEMYGYQYQDCRIPSCYNFMLQHEIDYPEWVFTPKRYLNIFGI